jgi:hypothetical protein
MFSSPCSLRSAQCATLIALAAAAGISRFEPAPAKPTASLRAIVSVLAAVAKSPQAPSYPVSLAACAHTAPIAQTTLAASAVATLPPLAAASPATGWSPAPSAIEIDITFFNWVGAVPTARQHSYPYAVGPPRRGSHLPLRVAGNALPGDSSTRRSQVSRIARVFIFELSAPPMRLADSGPKLAESISSPGSALRGEPENSPPSLRLIAAAARRGRHGDIFSSPIPQPIRRRT